MFLDAPFQTLIERCLEQERAGDGTYRPLLHQAAIATGRYKSRRLLYTAHARLTLNIAENSREEVVELIFEAISKSSYSIQEHRRNGRPPQSF
ncbi:MAG: hypothetical protein ACJ72H_05575 [Candidatus Sulfotelmatobacter sp.]